MDCAKFNLTAKRGPQNMILDQMIKQFKEKGLKGGKGIQISEGGKGDDGKGDKGKGDKEKG